VGGDQLRGTGLHPVQRPPPKPGGGHLAGPERHDGSLDPQGGRSDARGGERPGGGILCEARPHQKGIPNAANSSNNNTNSTNPSPPPTIPITAATIPATAIAITVAIATRAPFRQGPAKDLADGGQRGVASVQNEGGPLLQKPAGGPRGAAAGGSRTETLQGTLQVQAVDTYNAIQYNTAATTATAAGFRSMDPAPTISTKQSVPIPFVASWPANAQPAHKTEIETVANVFFSA